MKKHKILVIIFLLFISPTIFSQTVLNGQGNGFLSPNAPQVRLMDSAYNYKWDTASSAWTLIQKEYKNKNASGLVTEDLYQVYLSSSGQWSNKNHFLYTYFPGSTAVQAMKGQLWNTLSSDWLDYQYTHYADSLHVDTIYSKTWDQSQHKFSGGTREFYKYDSLNTVILYTRQFLDPLSQNWLNTQLVSDTFNMYEKVLEELTFSWNTISGSWINNYKKDYLYDTTGYKLLTKLEYTWNNDSSFWVNAYRTTYTNTPAGKPVLEVLEAWDPITKKWVNSLKDQIVYTPDGYLGTDIQQVFDVSNQVWKNHYLTVYSYFPTGIQHTVTGSFWNNSNWIENSLHQVDSLNHPVEDYSLSYNPETFVFTGGTRYTHHYDVFGGDTLYLVQTWDIGSSSWVGYQQDLYSYDITWHLLATDITQNWKKTLSDWQNTSKWVYFYSDYFGIQEKAAQTRYCFFNNPLVSGTEIKCPLLTDGIIYDVTLFSLTGSLVWRTTLSGNGSFIFDASVAPGIYFLRLTAKGKVVYQDKVIITR